jgi:hypothetical protein
MGYRNYILLPEKLLAFETRIDLFTFDEDVLDVLDKLGDEENYCDLDKPTTAKITLKTLSSQQMINDLCSEMCLTDYMLLHFLKRNNIKFEISEKKPNNYILI